VLGAERERHVGVADPALDAVRNAGVRDDIARRIRKACTHLSENEFGQLVDEMADRQLRGERRISREFWPE